ncbi:hypothetical protein [Paraburkholderia terrae]
MVAVVKLDGCPDRSARITAVSRNANNIFEDAHTVTLLADLPGVSRDKPGVEVHDGSLTIEAESVVVRQGSTKRFVASGMQ